MSAHRRRLRLWTSMLQSLEVEPGLNPCTGLRGWRFLPFRLQLLYPIQSGRLAAVEAVRFRDPCRTTSPSLPVTYLHTARHRPESSLVLRTRRPRRSFAHRSSSSRG
jgi:hypothetical protein